MIKESITPKEVVDFLNSLLEIDREGISALFASRVECDRELANHPTVQVSNYRQKSRVPSIPEIIEVVDDAPVFQVGPLGILNGLLGAHDEGEHRGWGAIAMLVDEDEVTISQFFLIYPISDIVDRLLLSMGLVSGSEEDEG